MSDQVTTPILSEAVKLGDLYYLSGQIGTDPATGSFAGEDIASQARQSLTNISKVLEQI